MRLKNDERTVSPAMKNDSRLEKILARIPEPEAVQELISYAQDMESGLKWISEMSIDWSVYDAKTRAKIALGEI